jgi:hypothetical protein
MRTESLQAITAESIRGNSGLRQAPITILPIGMLSGDGAKMSQARQHDELMILMRTIRLSIAGITISKVSKRPNMSPNQKSETIHCTADKVMELYRIAYNGIQLAMLASIPPYKRNAAVQRHASLIA